jgi:uncharacterized membrane protein
MPEHAHLPNDDPSQKLEETMQKVSRVVSLTGLGLMLAGLFTYFIGSTNFSLPGEPVIPLQNFLQAGGDPLSLVLMSSGILLFALLPLLRVILALWTYSSKKAWLNTLASFIVFLELLFSMRTGA